MASKLVKKNVVSPAAGKMYFVKNGNLYETTMNRKGGKKGRKVSKCAPKKKTVRKASKKAVKKVAKKKVAKKAVKKVTKKKVTKKAASKK